MTGCSVNGTESVNGTDYSGGFIGRASNAVVAGALDHLGIQIADFPVNTVMLGCSINGSANVSATGSSGKESGYAGGFIGKCVTVMPWTAVFLLLVQCPEKIIPEDLPA